MSAYLTPPRSKPYRLWVGWLALAGVVALWLSVVELGLVSRAILPSPLDVLTALMKDMQLLGLHACITLLEALIGLVLGLLVGVALGIVAARFRVVHESVQPLLTTSQTIPAVALAPLMVLWFGHGILPKIILVLLTTFFPITVSVLDAMMHADPDTEQALQSMGARPWQILWHYKLPYALPALMSGLKVAATYAIIAAVVAEWLGGSAGLGVYMTRVRKSFAYDRLFAAILVTSVLSLGLMKVVDLCAQLSMPWKRR